MGKKNKNKEKKSFTETIDKVVKETNEVEKVVPEEVEVKKEESKKEKPQKKPKKPKVQPRRKPVMISNHVLRKNIRKRIQKEQSGIGVKEI